MSIYTITSISIYAYFVLFLVDIFISIFAKNKYLVPNVNLILKLNIKVGIFFALMIRLIVILFIVTVLSRPTVGFMSLPLGALAYAILIFSIVRQLLTVARTD